MPPSRLCRTSGARSPQSGISEFLLVLLTTAYLWSTSYVRAQDIPAMTGKFLVLNPHALPLGDGKVSAQPQPGYVYSCGSNFRGGGAQHTGDWINGVTWDEAKKIFVRGAVAWPDASFAQSQSNGKRRVVGNSLPTNHTTGIFPIRRDDMAYQIDRNPNAIASQKIDWSLPPVPAFATQPTCVPMGIVGVMLNGVPLFNALDAAGRDAVAHEVQDRCGGHPESKGQYHYHGPSTCIQGAADNNTLIGYAADGFGIYSMFDANGKELTNADLDACHGRTSLVAWDGAQVNMYHYVLTREYPYTIGCFRGKPVSMRVGDGATPGTEQGMRPLNRMQMGRQPPPEAIQACAGLPAGAACNFVTPRGNTILGTCNSPGGVAACGPQRP